MIHGEEDFNSDSDIDDGGGRGGGGGGGGAGGGRGEACGSDTESAVDNRPLNRGFVRVLWYPEGGKQDIRETKVPHTSQVFTLTPGVHCDLPRRPHLFTPCCGFREMSGLVTT